MCSIYGMQGRPPLKIEKIIALCDYNASFPVIFSFISTLNKRTIINIIDKSLFGDSES